MGIITIADFSGLYNSARSMLGSFERIMNVAKRFYENDLYIQKFRDFYFEERETSQSVVQEIDLLKQKDYEICFNHVSFAYSGMQRNALDNICLKIKKGEKNCYCRRKWSGKNNISRSPFEVI